MSIIEAEIVAEYYASGSGAFSNNTMPMEHYNALGAMTFCVLILRNGHKVVGINHGPVDPAGFSAEHGRTDARNKAIDQVWELLGFRLRDRLHAGPVMCESAKIDPEAWNQLKVTGWGTGIVRQAAAADDIVLDHLAGEQPPTEQPEPTLSADELPSAIADAARDHVQAKADERLAQNELDDATERRRKRLTEMAEATAKREATADKLLELTRNVMVGAPRT